MMNVSDRRIPPRMFELSNLRATRSLRYRLVIDDGNRNHVVSGEWCRDLQPMTIQRGGKAITVLPVSVLTVRYTEWRSPQ